MNPKLTIFWGVGYNVLWYITISNGADNPLISTFAVLAWTILCGTLQDKKVWRVVLCALCLSLIGDSILGYLGVLKLYDGTPFLLAPIWLTGLWAAFATIIPLCFTWLNGRLWLASILAAVSGPMSYMAGGKMGAMTVSPDWFSISMIAIEWAVAMPLLVWISKK